MSRSRLILVPVRKKNLTVIRRTVEERKEEEKNKMDKLK